MMRDSPPRRLRALLTQALLLIALPTLGWGQTAREIAQRTFPSVVTLLLQDRNGQLLSLGTGFFIDSTTVVTNYHVVQGAFGGHAKIVGRPETHPIRGVAAISSEWDLALLLLAGATAPALQLGDAATVAVGDPVYAVGSPRGLEGTFSEGIVSGVRSAGRDHLFQITAPISPGSSGGPVLDRTGSVIGVATATLQGGQNLNFAIPVTYLSELVARERTVASLASGVPQSSEQSIVNRFGERNIQGVDATHFAWTDNQYMGYYRFSIQNKLSEPIQHVTCLVIFYARDDSPIETELVRIPGPIPPRLARRSQDFGRIRADEVRNLTRRVEIRVLDFAVGR